MNQGACNVPLNLLRNGPTNFLINQAVFYNFKSGALLTSSVPWDQNISMQKIFREIFGISKTPDIFALKTNIELDLNEISYSAY